MPILINDLLAPLVRRVGSMAAAALMAQGVADGHAATLADILVALLLLGVDLVNSAAARRIKPVE